LSYFDEYLAAYVFFVGKVQAEQAEGSSQSERGCGKAKAESNHVVVHTGITTQKQIIQMM
jgi:hypothetical protein